MEKLKRYGLIGLIAIALLGTFSSCGLGYWVYTTKSDLANTNRVINSKIDEIQEFDSKLGVSESNLRREEDLRKTYEKEVIEFQKDLQEKTERLNIKELQLASRDQTIAALQRKIKGGDSSVTVVEKKKGDDGKEVVFETIIDVKEVCSDKVLAYTWEDSHKRFKLKDPDIGISGNEVFSYRQYIKITGLVLSDDTGNVQVKKLTATEVLEEKDPDGKTTYVPVKDGDLVLLDSKFEYINKVEDGKSLLDGITLRPFASFDTSFAPGIGVELVNLGRYVDYANFGIYGKLAFDVRDPVGGSLQNSRVGVGVAYHLVPPLLPTNFAIGASISTPFNNLGQPVFSIDVILYLTEDLGPSRWLE